MSMTKIYILPAVFLLSIACLMCACGDSKKVEIVRDAAQTVMDVHSRVACPSCGVENQYSDFSLCAPNWKRCPSCKGEIAESALLNEIRKKR